MSVKHLTKEDFENIMANEERTVLVDFYADWCGPCKAFAPLLDEFAEEHENTVVAKLNIEECPDIAREYGIRSVPTLIVYKNGEVMKRSVGVPTKEDLADLVAG